VRARSRPALTVAVVLSLLFGDWDTLRGPAHDPYVYVCRTFETCSSTRKPIPAHKRDFRVPQRCDNGHDMDRRITRSQWRQRWRT
jgi:hypothetical protein